MRQISLKDIQLKFNYRSSSDVIYKDFYLPCLKESVRYDRAVGYFTSSVLSLLSSSLDPFLSKNGKIRIIANPRLSKEDLDAINLGYKAREDVITEALLKELEDSDDMTNLDTLALLVYREQLDIKIASAKSNGIYHEKFGIFTDEENNSVAFSGSANETYSGLSENFESINVFYESSDNHRINAMILDFDNLWNNRTEGLVVEDVPEKVKQRLSDIAQTSLRMSNNNAHFIKLRDYQEEAMNAIIDNDWHGILEMATGTGKTYTSLLIAQEYFARFNRLFLLIIVPFKHLTDQWIENLNNLGIKDHEIVKCSSDNRKWENELHIAHRDFENGLTNRQVVITTYQTAAKENFKDYVTTIRENTFLIADECHYFGQRRMKDNNLDNYRAKVGLSATPERWYDSEGSSYISEFFRGTVFIYSLKKAIANGYLTEYQYEPVITGLTEFEAEDYDDFTRQIIPLMNIENRNQNQEKRLSSLLIQRSRIIKGAKLKTEELLKILSKKDIENSSHTLVYCAEGQVDYLTKELSDLGYRCHRFDHRVSSKDRQLVLDSFAEGEIQILVAINCLDEGVDVPSTRTAYFLSSTSNPRQFVQRRGRVLRTSPNKHKAEIYDFITIPTNVKESTFSSIVSRELPRISEFTESALNKYPSRDVIEPYLKYKSVDLRSMLDKTSNEDYDKYVLEDIEDSDYKE